MVEHKLPKFVVVSLIVRSIFSVVFWGHSSAGRAVALQAIGRRFDPVWLHQFSAVQLGYYRDLLCLEVLARQKSPPELLARHPVGIKSRCYTTAWGLCLRQMGLRYALNIPLAHARLCGSSSVVEQNVANVQVASSSLVSRSILSIDDRDRPQASQSKEGYSASRRIVPVNADP